MWSVFVAASSHCPGTGMSELANFATGVGVCSRIRIRNLFQGLSSSNGYPISSIRSHQGLFSGWDLPYTNQYWLQ